MSEKISAGKKEFLRAVNKEKIPEYAVLAFFIALYTVVTVFHEPWFDEAQAWQIAKYASLKDIFFKLPHTEGHPPLWHLLLMIPARTGVPYEIGLKVTAAIPTVITAALILFRSPFPKIVRLLLPFNYFIFYQYGVISRPYCLLVLAMILLAIYFDTKDSRPWRYVCLLVFLCLTSAYGFIIAGGVSVAWVTDILKRNRTLKRSLRDKCVPPLLVLLAFAVLLAAQIAPLKQAYAANAEYKGGMVSRILYAFFGILSDSIFTSAVYENSAVNDVTFSLGQIIPVVVVGSIILLVLAFFLPKEKKKYFFIPYGLLIVFACLVYFSGNHIGVMSFLVLFAIWISCEELPSKVGKIIGSIKASEKDKGILKKAVKVLTAAGLIVPFLWTAFAAVNDIRVPYFYSRGAAAFIKANGLSELYIFCPSEKNLTEDAGGEKKEYYNVDFPNNAVQLTAYFDTNIISNLNLGDDSQPYLTHIIPTYDEAMTVIDKWRENGLPDVLVGKINVRDIFGEDLEIPEYVPVYQMKSVGISIWKYYCNDGSDINYDYIYIRSDLLDEYNLEPLEVDDYWRFLNSN